MSRYTVHVTTKSHGPNRRAPALGGFGRGKREERIRLRRSSYIAAYSNFQSSLRASAVVRSVVVPKRTQIYSNV